MGTIAADLVRAVTNTLSLKGATSSDVVRLGEDQLSVPNADGAAGTLLATDGSNDLEFIAAPGSSGNILTSNGSAWTSGSPPADPFSWYNNIAVITSGEDFFNGGANGTVPNYTSGTYTIPATQLFVIVMGAGGNSHNATQGGTTSFGSYVSATGGYGSAHVTSGYAMAPGGLGADGDINLRGSMAGYSAAGNPTGNPVNQAPMFGGTTYAYGGGGGSTHYGWGAAGGYAQKRITGLTVSATVTITVAAEIHDGGYDGTYGSHKGGQGVCIIMYA